MIESIDLESNRINMHPLPDKNGKRFRLFNADSLNILIGNNGAGKTRALKHIVSAMSYGEALGCTVNLSDGDVPSDELLKFGTVYYTAIPYPVKLPSEDFRFINASLDLSKAEVADQIDVEQFEALASALKIPTRPMITMACDFSLTLPLVAKALLRCIKEENFSHLSQSLNLPTDEISRHYSSLINALALPLRRSSYDEVHKKKISASHLHLAETICDQIRLLIQLRSPYHELPTLAALTATMENTRDTTAVAIVFLKDILQLNLGAASRFPSVEAQLSQTFNNNLRTATQIFDAEGNWEIAEAIGSLTASVEYQNSEILARLSDQGVRDFITVTWENFSSGQLALLYQFTALRHAARELTRRKINQILFLLDEGDIFLHASWQRRYIELFDNFIAALRKELGLKTVQVILTTHSPVVITDIPREFIVRLDRDTKQKPTVLGFAAAQQDIVNSSLDADSIGSFAEKLLMKTAKNIKRRGATDRDKYVISLIDDPFIKGEFMRLSANNTHD